MGPDKYRGIGNTRRGIIQALPTAPGNGSGGPGVLAAAIGNTDAGNAILDRVQGASETTVTGQVTLGMVALTILAMLGFYYWTRTAQGGG